MNKFERIVKVLKESGFWFDIIPNDPVSIRQQNFSIAIKNPRKPLTDHCLIDFREPQVRCRHTKGFGTTTSFLNMNSKKRFCLD